MTVDTDNHTELLLIEHLHRQTALLEQLVAEDRAELTQLAVLDRRTQQLVLDSFPVPGAKRLLAYRTGNGFDSFAVDTAGELFVQANEGRLGGQVTNTGANPVILYLAAGKRAGVPAVYLGSNGGWDFRFGGITWCGNVFAVATTGTSTLVGGEL